MIISLFMNSGPSVDSYYQKRLLSNDQANSTESRWMRIVTIINEMDEYLTRISADAKHDDCHKWLNCKTNYDSEQLNENEGKATNIFTSVSLIWHILNLIF